jgi:serine/threonine-protein kinase HipA
MWHPINGDAFLCTKQPAESLVNWSAFLLLPTCALVTSPLAPPPQNPSSARHGVTRRGFVSGLTATGLISLSDSVFGGVGYRDLVSWLRKHGCEYKSDSQELFKRMGFNTLCNNTDDHLKNHGFLRVNSQWKLSPLYDIVPSHETGTEGRQLLLAVGIRGREASIENAISEAHLFGLKPKEATEMVSHILSIALSTLKNYFLSQEGG